MNSSLESVRRQRAAREKLQKIAERISGMGLGPRRRVQMVRISTICWTRRVLAAPGGEPSTRRPRRKAAHSRVSASWTSSAAAPR